MSLLAFCCAALVHAADEINENPPIKAGAMIEISTWLPKEKLFNVHLVKQPAVGPNYVPLEALAKAADRPDFLKHRAHPERIVGEIVQLTHALPRTPPEALTKN